MGRKVASQVLTVTGVLCLAGYVFAAPRGVSPTLVRVGGALFYAGLAALAAGSSCG